MCTSIQSSPVSSLLSAPSSQVHTHTRPTAVSYLLRTWPCSRPSPNSYQAQHPSSTCPRTCHRAVSYPPLTLPVPSPTPVTRPVPGTQLPSTPAHHPPSNCHTAVLYLVQYLPRTRPCTRLSPTPYLAEHLLSTPSRNRLARAPTCP